MSTAGSLPPRPACTSELAALHRENRELRDALVTRPVIEQAKGALMWRFRLSDEAAFAVLRRWSQDSNIKLHTVADVLVNVVARGDANGTRMSELARWLGEQMSQHVAEQVGERTSERGECVGERVGLPEPVPARWVPAIDAWR